MSEEPLPAEMPGRDPSGRFLPRNPPQRSAERQHLRRADRAPRYQLLAHAARLSDARERLNLRELKASRAQAAAALRNAEEQAPQQLVDRLLGAVAADVLTVADATARLAEEETAYDEASAARVLLDDELEEIRLQLGVLRLRCDNALSAVLQTDPRVEMLWQRHHEARQVVADLDRCLRVVDHAGGIEPADRGCAAFREYPDRGNSEAWKLAVAKLAVDADALLPVSEEEELRGEAET